MRKQLSEYRNKKNRILIAKSRSIINNNTTPLLYYKTELHNLINCLHNMMVDDGYYILLENNIGFSLWYYRSKTKYEDPFNIAIGCTTTYHACSKSTIRVNKYNIRELMDIYPR